jgi:ubiquinone/menaquinone biosynthesis C-methylase UbiE
MKKNLTDSTRQWYTKYYERKGEFRNSILNPEVLFQNFAMEASILSGLRLLNLNEKAKILDIGCAGGGSLKRFLELGIDPLNLYGIDILSELIDEGKRNYPSMNLIEGDASNLPYDSNYFDIVMESTMFMQLTDDKMSKQIANEMIRVLKPGCHMILVDWRYANPFSKTHMAFNTSRLKTLFLSNKECEILQVSTGALIPPLGRFISKYFPSMYFLIKKLFPILSGQTCTVLIKKMS